MNEIIKLPGNSICVDCDAKNPDWASINLGVLVCLTCSGSHRHLGVHISQVRSLKLDTECWQGELLKYMCSIGNNAFNRAWEKNCPAHIIHPDEYPYNPSVRENYITQKYLYRRFLRREASDGDNDSPNSNNSNNNSNNSNNNPNNSTCATPASADISEGMVLKHSPTNVIKPWQNRFLKFKTTPHGNVLEYYKQNPASSSNSPQGAVDLNGSEAEIVTGTDKDLQHCFSIVTSSESEHSGRTFEFSVGSAKETVKWVEAVRKHSGQISKLSKNSGPPVMCSMEMSRLNLKRKAIAGIEQEEIIMQGELLHRAAYTFGGFYSRWGLLTKEALFVFEAEGELGKCVCVLPTHGAHVDKNPFSYEGVEKLGRGAFGLLTALSHNVFDAQTEDSKIDWVAALTSNITVITIGK